VYPQRTIGAPQIILITFSRSDLLWKKFRILLVSRKSEALLKAFVPHLRRGPERCIDDLSPPGGCTDGALFPGGFINRVESIFPDLNRHFYNNIPVSLTRLRRIILTVGKACGLAEECNPKALNRAMM
jgi:hypothetical protein